MPRRARLQVPGLPVHVVQRGNNRSDCFYSDIDRRVYLGLLRKLAAAHRCRVHAYVLMTDHVHLLLTPEQPSDASMLMKHLGQGYVQFVNKTYDRTGSLWEGRFRSSIIESEAYLLTCHRYIELNPVRAGLAGNPADYRWSSYRSNGLGEQSGLITPHELYLRLGPTPQDRQAAYRALFGCPDPVPQFDEIRRAALGGFAVGGKAFVVHVERSTGRRASPAARGRPQKRIEDGPCLSARRKNGVCP